MSCLKVVMKSIKTAKGGKNTDDDFLLESLHLMTVENVIVELQYQHYRLLYHTYNY